ncbi:hypothetical protein ILUMI_21539 [Ignelater luminosus]|uniref:Uncharacterized protein n=1 Tax=Ignelater luminosus TaxID=2038154 RepID=A0A8K0CFF5_IGNLU|nr:hypothetical protein ILUMI_21539 [Ignelater luminosus]
MHFLQLVLFTAAVLFKHVHSVTVVVNNVEGYYWREYTGELPQDAVPGGLDKHGKTTYIGQALHIFPPNGKLIPGKIDADEKKMYYAWNDIKHVVTKNVKILCSQNPTNFKWIETDIQNIKSMPQEKFVLGGYDTDYPLYIGRKHTNGEVVLGKVTIPTPYDAFGYTIGEKAYFVKDTFEVLSYDSNTESTCTPTISKCSPEKIINIYVR